VKRQSSALEGIRVLDLTIFLSGPLATMYLAGLGAEVIKIERPGLGDPARRNPPVLGRQGVNFEQARDGDVSLSMLKRGRGKQSVALNLKESAGRELFLDLVKVSDVVVENFRPGTLARLGLAAEVLLEVNPRVVVCSISGFGQTGPYAELPAMDLVAQAMSGAMAVTGREGEEPMRTGIAAGDLVAGLSATIAILAALRHRDRTGEGQCIDVSMQDALLAAVFDEAPDVFARHGVPVRTGNRRARLTPFNSYRVSDGWIVITCGDNGHWNSLLKAMGREDLIEQDFYSSQAERFAEAERVDAFVEKWTAARSSAEVIGALRAHGVPCAPVCDALELLEDPHVLQRGILRPLQSPSGSQEEAVFAPELPMVFSATPAKFARPAPALGEHTAEVLRRLLHLDDSEIDRLVRSGIVQ
jgi:crotonobetainyl-CoA:carnitine CoA-transferase CaiB-like acyl-CoA transferase